MTATKERCYNSEITYRVPESDARSNLLLAHNSLPLSSSSLDAWTKSKVIRHTLKGGTRVKELIKFRDVALRHAFLRTGGEIHHHIGSTRASGKEEPN